MLISVVNRSKKKTDQEVQAAVRAVNRQLGEDFRLYWHKEVRMRLESSAILTDHDNPREMRGSAILYIVDNAGDEDALGYHDLNHAGVPYGYVFIDLAEELGEPWTIILSHEALELAVDPEVNLFVRGPHPEDPTREVLHWYEVCDAVQNESYEIDGIPVSNFLLPLYFTTDDERGSRNDFLGATNGRAEPVPSFGVADGGYVGFYDPLVGGHETFTNDARGAKRVRIKEEYGLTRRGLRYEIGEADGSGSTRFDCITVLLDPDSGPKSPKSPKKKSSGARSGTRAKAKSRGRKKTYKSSSPASRLLEKLGKGWTAMPVVGGAAGEFDLFPPPGRTITSAEAWDLSYGMLDEAGVESAEPVFDYPIEVDSQPENAPDGRRASSIFGLPHKEGTEDRDWTVKLVNAFAAWALPTKPGGKHFGEGIRIGHPDSGYRPHLELDAARIDTRLDKDFVDKDTETSDASASHGLGTGSVIISGLEDNPGLHITGTAPKAVLIPLRVTKPGLKPTPVLFWTGMRRLRDAINYAVDHNCHVVSISLGGIPFHYGSLRRALRKAEENDVLVFAAAGNEVRIVVWPARFDEVVAVAGCNIHRKPWPGSSRGKDVEVTAPGESVWRATYDGDFERMERGFGTSFAVAMVAGVAASWLSYHGRNKLISTLGKGNLAAAFRRILHEHGCDSSPHLPPGQFGAGVINMEKVLLAPLDPARGRRGMARGATIAVPNPTMEVAELLNEDSMSAVRESVGAALGVDCGEVDPLLEELGNEVSFNIVTNPSFRHALQAGCIRARRGRTAESSAMVVRGASRKALSKRALQR